MGSSCIIIMRGCTLQAIVMLKPKQDLIKRVMDT